MDKINISNRDPIFQASYSFGPEDQRIKKKRAINNIFESNIVRPFKTNIYPGASFLKNKFIDKSRVEASLNQLASIGGKNVKMKTPDGDVLDGMYLNANQFKSTVEKYFNVVKINQNGEDLQYLFVKPEFCAKIDFRSYYYLKPNKEVSTFIETLSKLGFKADSEADIPEMPRMKGLCFKLGPVSSYSPPATDKKSSPTALIVGGAGLNYSFYKGLALSYLLRGVNVMMVDFRGYGKSEGSPTSHKTKLDLETAYQYLAKEKGVENKDLVVHGHCLGGASATDLAARREGVNLILDRSFADYREAARDVVPRFNKIVHKILPLIVDYNNTKNLSKTKGNIAIEMDTMDELFDTEETIKILNSLSDTEKGQIIKLIHSNVGHTGIWVQDPYTAKQFDQFLEQANLRRNLF